MKIGILWRRNRNVEYQKRISKTELKDDAKVEALQHTKGLTSAGFECELIEWTHDSAKMIKQIQKLGIDLVFNASSVEELIFLEDFHVPYVGTQLQTVMMDKAQRKILAAHAGVRTPRFFVVEKDQDIPEHQLTYPLFVKPLNGRGSAGIDDSNIINKAEELAPVIHKITYDLGQAALVEEFVQGREITVGIIKTQGMEVLPIIEIEYTFGQTNTFEHKMLDHEKLTCPANLSESLRNTIIQQARLAFRCLNIQDFGRIDMMIDQHDVPYFLEVNTFAGLTYPDRQDGAHLGYMGLMAKTQGIKQKDFLKQIIESSYDRYPFLKNI